MDRNELFVINLKTKLVVFRAQYKDAQGKVVRAFYMDGVNPPLESADVTEEEDNPQQIIEDYEERFKDDKILGDEEEEDTSEIEQMRENAANDGIRMRQKRLPLF